MAAASNSKKTVMDVSKPGKTAATATSRPVIITHGALVKDPMVNEEAATDTPVQETQAPITPAAKKVIAPLSAAENAEAKAESETETDTIKQEVAAEETSKKDPVAETKPSEKDEPESEDETESEEAVVDAVVEQVADKKAQEQAGVEEQKRQELVTKLVADKKYFVPLAVARRERNGKLGVVFAVALLPLFVGLILAVDAELIGQGIDLPFDFIKR
jgi:hypothetical protein